MIHAPVIVPQPRASYSLAGQRILFASSDGERSAYQFGQWLEPLPDMVRKDLVKKLECARVGPMVLSQPDRADQGVRVSVEIVEFFHEAKTQPGEAVINLRAELTDLGQQRTKATADFSKRLPVKSYDVEGASAAFNEGLNAALDDLVAWTAKTAAGQASS